MSNEDIRKLLDKLHDELQKTEVDAETRSLIRELDADIHNLAAANSDSVLERARLLEAKFATEHPVAERFMTEVINTLVRMGI